MTVDTQEWNIFRYTRDGDQFALYVNEESTAIVTGTAQGDRTNDFFRFGDGWGSSGTRGVSTDFDWVTWDLTGSYSPDEQALPDELVEIPVGDWTIYQADLDPVTEFTPAFEESNVSGVNERTQIPDPDRTSNNLLRIVTDQDTDGNNDNYQLRQQLGASTPTAITVVFRAKGNDPAKVLLFDMDMDFNTFRSQIRIHTDGTVDIANGTEDATPNPLTVNTQEWNIYRYTRDGDQFALYVNEESTAIVTGTAQGDRTNDFFRFGDGWGSSGTRGVSTDFDWVTWDLSGAYSPDQTRLPDDLVLPPLGDWTVYQADLDPLTEFTPAFEESNTAGVFERTQIPDPDDASNNLLRIVTDQDTDGNNDNYQLRQQIGATSPTAITVVFRAKGNDPAKVLLFDMDMDFNTFRSQIRIHTDGTVDVANGTEDAAPDPLTINTQDWNTYRYTRDGDQFALYINEEQTPVVTGTAQGDRTNDFFRFGDGWGSSGTRGISTDFDWVTWDLTGAYSPNGTRLPDELTGNDPDESVPEISTIGLPDPLHQDLGFAEDFTVDSYTVSGTDLTGDITVTPPANFEVSLNETDWFDSSSPITVSPVGGEVEATTIFVRLNASTDGEHSGDITHSSDGAENATVAVSGTTVTLIPEVSLIAELTDFVQNVSAPSAAQTYRVSGINLKSAITVTAPENFEVSSDEGVTWASAATYEPVDRTITNAIVSVRLNAGALGTYDGTITHSSTDVDDVTLAVSGETIPDPGITVTGTLTAFDQALGTPSAPQSYELSGTNLAGNLIVTVPASFEVSFNGDTWLDGLTLVPTNGNVDPLMIYVRLNAMEEGTFEGAIVHSSDGVDPVNLAVSGTSEEVTMSIDGEATFGLWPNPTVDHITINRKDIDLGAIVHIYSPSGKRVESQTFEIGSRVISFDVRNLMYGLYLVEYVTANERQTLRFLKN